MMDLSIGRLPCWMIRFVLHDFVMEAEIFFPSFLDPFGMIFVN